MSESDLLESTFHVNRVFVLYPSLFVRRFKCSRTGCICVAAAACEPSGDSIQTVTTWCHSAHEDQTPLKSPGREAQSSRWENFRLNNNKRNEKSLNAWIGLFNNETGQISVSTNGAAYKSFYSHRISHWPVETRPCLFVRVEQRGKN